MQSDPMQELRSVVPYLAELYCARSGGFRFQAGAPVTLLSTAFAVQTHSLLRALDAIDQEHVGETLRTAQRSDGWFMDPEFRSDDLSGSHSAAYLRSQFSFFALTALDMLGLTPRYPLAFMQPFLDAHSLATWLSELAWDDFWYASNELMFVLYFLSYASERQGDARARASLEQCLDVLDARVDPATGYWGAPGADRHNMFGAAHIYMFYEFTGRPLAHAPAIVDTTLALQTSGGLFAAPHGGACEDFDGVEVLLRARPHCSRDQWPHIDAALQRTAEAVAQHPSGGFAYRQSDAGVVATLGRLRSPRTYTYSGWRRMRARSFEPDTWATFFRTLILAAIATAQGDASFAGYDLPSWGALGLRAKK